MSSPRRASGPEDCSKHVARRQRSSCLRMCCVCVERHTICRWKSVAAVDDFRRPDVCRRRGTEVRDKTKTRRQNTLVCSQRVSELAASATAAKPARYDRVVRLQWEVYKVIDLGVNGKPRCDFLLVFEILTFKARKWLVFRFPPLPSLTLPLGGTL